MKYPACKLGFLRGLLALFVSLAIIASSHAYSLASFGNSIKQPAQIESGDELLFATATVTETGVRLEWASKRDPDNLGFNIYRLRDGQRSRINREVIPGSLFLAGPNASAAAIAVRSHSHGWVDLRGTADSVYYIESVSLSRPARFHRPLTPVFENVPGKKQFPRLSQAPTQPEISGADSTDSFDTSYRELGYPVRANAAPRQQMMASTLEEQWAIAAQTGVKIAVRHQGWYRVTQPQMAAVGFSPTVDIRNLQLFVDGQEMAINTSQSAGPFGPSDYIEFFGSGLDLPTTDVRTYYLIAGTTAGKRVRGELQVDSIPDSTPAPQATPPPGPGANPVPSPKNPWSVWQWEKWEISAGQPIGIWFISGLLILPVAKPRQSENTIAVVPSPFSPGPMSVDQKSDSSFCAALPASELPAVAGAPVLLSEPPAVAGGPALLSEPPALAGGPSNELKPSPPMRAFRAKKKRNRKRVRRQAPAPKREHSHALAPAAGPSSFQYTVERKDRIVYFSSLLNGDEENWFGQVISNPTTPATQTLTTPNPAYSAAGPARLEVRLQGANHVTHQVSVKFNEVVVGNFSFFGVGSSVLAFDVPLSLLQNGANTLKFTPAGSGDVSIVDYARITYPHTFRADSDILNFSLLGTQTLQVDGFSSNAVQVIDYTDPFNVSLIKPEPATNPGGSGSNIIIPPSNPQTKAQRLLYATGAAPETPAAITLNQPSTLNLNTNNADFLIVTASFLRDSLAPLITAREAHGWNVEVVDVEDLYDEFSYGVHGPEAIKVFLERANVQWVLKPRYVIFAGDASYDPRNYEGHGNADFVPTKLVDATYNETASDDWLTDFDDNGIADISIGRLPLRTTAETDLVVSKIVNYTPANVPEAALLVADNPGTPPTWDFETSNDDVQALLPGSMTVQRINIRTQPSNAQATANIIASLNEGRVIVNYSGHGNVDVWTGNQIFRSIHASALTNGNKLSFVVVMDCLNGYFHVPTSSLQSLSEAFLKAPNGGAVAAFASSGLTITFGQRQMELELYTQLYGAQPIALGDAIKIAKAASGDIDVRRTWIFFGDPSIKIR